MKRIWVGGVRYGDDVNANSLLKGRLSDWTKVEPRLFDRLFYKKPDFVIPIGGKEGVLR